MIDDMVSDVRRFDSERKKRKSDRRRFPPREEENKCIERVE